MKSILIVKYLTPWHQEILNERKINYDQVAPLSFEYIYNPEVIQQQMHAANHIVITSSKSIEALKLIPVNERADKRISVVGEHTTQELITIGFKKIHDAKNSEELALSGKWNRTQPLLYLCGNLRKDTLSDFWQNHQVPFTEAIVYKTQFLHPVIDASLHSCILFFSPSSVTSVCSSNTLPSDMLIGSIGQSTTQRLHQYHFTNIIEAPESTFVSLIDTITKLI